MTNRYPWVSMWMVFTGGPQTQTPCLSSPSFSKHWQLVTTSHSKEDRAWKTEGFASQAGVKRLVRAIEGHRPERTNIWHVWQHHLCPWKTKHGSSKAVPCTYWPRLSVDHSTSTVEAATTSFSKKALLQTRLGNWFPYAVTTFQDSSTSLMDLSPTPA